MRKEIDSPFIRAEKAAELMGIALKTLHNNRYNKKGPKYYKVGKFVLYKPEEVLAYVEQHVIILEQCAA